MSVLLNSERRNKKTWLKTDIRKERGGVIKKRGKGMEKKTYVFIGPMRKTKRSRERKKRN